LEEAGNPGCLLGCYRDVGRHRLETRGFMPQAIRESQHVLETAALK
jgi:hypothetical protein